MRARNLSLAALLFVAGPALAQTSLAWKFERGQIFEAERIVSQKQIVEIASKQFKQERNLTWHIRLDVKEIQADAAIVLATLTKIEQQVIGGQDQELLDAKLHEKMQGSTFTLRVGPTGRIAALDGYEQLLKKLAAKDSARLKVLRGHYPESALTEAFADIFGLLPDKAVTKEDGWQREYVEPIPHFGLLRATARYVYQGNTGGQQRIAYTIQTKYEPPKIEAAALFRIVKGTIESEKAMGAIAFDAAAGRLIEHERTMLLRGTLTIEAADRRQTLDFTSENSMKTRVKTRK